VWRVGLGNLPPQEAFSEGVSAGSVAMITWAFVILVVALTAFGATALVAIGIAGNPGGWGEMPLLAASMRSVRLLRCWLPFQPALAHIDA
jgi:hypothetical protein